MRNICEKTGTLKKHKNFSGKVIPGIFDVIQHIPNYMTITSIRKAFNKNCNVVLTEDFGYAEIKKMDPNFLKINLNDL